MNYENSRPIGVVSSDSGHKAKYGNKDNITVFMTFEELKRTWTIRKHRKDDTKDDCPGNSGVD